jgi:hypothetical protein
MSAIKELYERLSNLISRGNVSAAEAIIKRLFPDDFDVEMQIKGVRSIMAEHLILDGKCGVPEDIPVPDNVKREHPSENHP